MIVFQYIDILLELLQAKHTIQSCKLLYYLRHKDQSSQDDLAFWDHVSPEYIEECKERYSHIIIDENVLDSEDEDEDDNMDGEDAADDDEQYSDDDDDDDDDADDDDDDEDYDNEDG